MAHSFKLKSHMPCITYPWAFHYSYVLKVCDTKRAMQIDKFEINLTFAFLGAERLMS